MPLELTSRRGFLAGTGGALGALASAAWPSISVAHAHAREAMAGSAVAALSYLTAAEAAVVEAIAAQIVASGATPGATEAGTVFFIDYSLQTWMAPHAPAFREGLKEFDATFQAGTPAGSFAAADSASQVAHLRSVETTPFFLTMRKLTIVGLFALPSYGGNRDGVGWKLIGFDDQHAFSPPFGHYDRDYPGFALPRNKL